MRCKQASFERSLKAMLIALIPKKCRVEDIKFFRPISLISSVYKIIAKFLSNRLEIVIDYVIFPFQQAFC